MAAIVDNLIAIRIIYLLVQPFKQWEAYKQGIIDENGERTEKSTEGSDDWSMLHRLVARLKKLLGTIPGGKSVIASVAAAYLLVRECVERDVEPELLEQYFNAAVESGEVMTIETYTFVSDTIYKITEDGAVIGNVVGTGNIAGAAPGEEPPVRKRKKKVMKRNVLDTSTSLP